jgi:hypothetical protein
MQHAGAIEAALHPLRGVPAPTGRLAGTAAAAAAAGAMRDAPARRADARAVPATLYPRQGRCLFSCYI